MSDDNERLQKIENELEAALHALQTFEQHVISLELRVKKLERARQMTNDEALRTFDTLRQADPSLTLPNFAEQYGLSYNALRQARSRRRKKT